VAVGTVPGEDPGTDCDPLHAASTAKEATTACLEALDILIGEIFLFFLKV
jgi:hypothetical protein